MPLPGSMYALDIEGGTVEATGLGFDDGDADRPCLPIPGTLVPVPWQADVAQVQLRMFDHDGSRFFGDPRWLLEQQLAASPRSDSRRWWLSSTSSTWWMRSAGPTDCRNRPRARSPGGANTARRSTP